jgi:monoterpene epsilon-lactone hydrolase
MRATWKLPDLRGSTYPTPTALTERRSLGANVEPATPAPNVIVRDTPVANVPCVVCELPGSNELALYFHGGGYRMGSARRSAPFATRLATAMLTTVVAVEYRLAPEEPFPAGLRDAATVYEHLLGRHDRIAVIGDSAGGGLAAALVVAAVGSGVPLPGAMVLMSPWLDLTCTAATFRSRAQSDQLFSLNAATEASAMYLQGHDSSDPLVSPGLAHLDAWPPTLLFASTDEVLLHDSVSFTSRLALAGTPVTSYFEPAVPHAWPAVVPDLPASRLALERISHFARTGWRGEHEVGSP